MDDVAKHALLMWEPKMCRLAWQLLGMLGNVFGMLCNVLGMLCKYIYIYYIVELLHGCHNLRLVYTFLNDLNTTIIPPHTHTHTHTHKRLATVYVQKATPYVFFNAIWSSKGYSNIALDKSKKKYIALDIIVNKYDTDIRKIVD